MTCYTRRNDGGGRRFLGLFLSKSPSLRGLILGRILRSTTHYRASRNAIYILGQGSQFIRTFSLSEKATARVAVAKGGDQAAADLWKGAIRKHVRWAVHRQTVGSLSFNGLNLADRGLDGLERLFGEV